MTIGGLIHPRLKPWCSASGRIEIKDSRARITKQRDLEFAKPIAFKLHPVEIAKNSDGEVITSCVVLQNLDYVQEMFNQYDLKPTSHAARALEVLKNAIRELGKSVPESSTETSCVSLSTWQQLCYKSYGEVCSNTKSSTFSRAKKELVKKGLIVQKDTYVYVVDIW